MDQGEHEAVRLSRENAIVAEVGSIINSSLDIEDVYERFAEEVRKLVPFDRIAINLLDLKENCSRIAYANGIVVSGRDKGDAVTLNGSLSSEVIKSRKGLFIPTGEIEGYAERFPVFRRTVQAGFRSLMLVPLISKGEVIAILHFRSTLPDVYSEKELRIAERVGYQITSAIVNAQIYAAQKRTEKALRESEKRFKDLYDNAPSGYHEYDLEGRITQVNRTELQLLGYSQEEMIGRYVWELNVHTEDARKDVLGRLSGTLPPARELERIFRRKDGTTLPVLITNRIIRDGQGRLTGVRSSLQDITERKRAEEELRQREEQYRNIFESAADGLLILNPSGTIVDANPRACEMYGYRREEILGLSGTSIIHKENRPLFDQFRKGIQERGGFHTEAIGLRKDGSSFHAEVRGGTFQFRGGPHLLAVVRDATDRKRAEEALRRSEERYRSLYDEAPVGYIEYDADARITSVNRKEAEMLGYGVEEILGRPAWDFVVERDEAERVIRGKLEGEIPPSTSLERLYRRKDGTTISAMIGDAILRDGSGRIMGVRATIQDITERKEAEEEKEKLRVQLLQAQKMESVGRLAGGVAHDFNNMLGIIIGHSEIAALHCDPGDRLHQNLQAILDAANRSAAIVRQLLAFARKQIISPKVLDLNDTVSESLKMMRRLIGEDIILTWMPGKDVWRVQMDPSQIQQILANLLVNSRDAMPDGGRITLESAKCFLPESYCRNHPGVKPGEYAMLTVSDTGTGMSREVMEQIFDPFFTTKEVGRGTGLGLATVHGIVNQNQGSIDVFSEPGQGTTFKIYLPRCDEDQRPEDTKKESMGSPKGHETVLLVEDEEPLLEIAKSILQAQGYTVLHAAAPVEALLVADQHQGEIHLVIADVILPGMNGRELVQRLQVARPRMKSLYMSGYTADVIAHHGILDRNLSFIEKPFSSRSLAEKVREVLDKQ